MTEQPRHFIIGGAQRSATTFLTKMLDSHPAIEMAKPSRPEPKFFIGEAYTSLTKAEYVSTYFSQRDEQAKWLGEKSTSYIEFSQVAERIASFFDKPKLMFALRNPVERAISNFHFSRMHGYETENINTALLREIDAPENIHTSKQSGTSVSPQAYLARGKYIDFLPAFFSHFPAKDILLIKSEELTRSPAECNRVFNFLGLEPRYEETILSRVNASSKDQEQVLEVDVRKRLEAYFLDANQKLSSQYGFDVTDWLGL